MVAIAAEVLAELVAALGNDAVTPWDEIATEKRSQIMTAIASEQPPTCRVSPVNTEALSKVMALAAANHWRVLTTGNGSKLSWGGLAEGIEVVVSTARLNQVIDHAVGDFTVTAQPGLTVTELRQTLAAQGQFLAIDPTFDDHATLGGVVSTADTGSLRQRYGGLRDMLIGVQFVRYDGEVAQAGGRVVKNVAGYDLMKLLTGAYGSLGIISELTFRLYPMQTKSRTIVLTGGSKAIEAAVVEMRMSGLTPVALDVLSIGLIKTLPALLVPVEPGKLAVVARFQGVADGVEEQTERLQKIGTTHSMGYHRLDGDEDATFWQDSARLIRPNTVLCKVGLRPSGIHWLIELADELAPDSQLRLYGSSGLGWIQLASSDAAAEIVEQLRSHCLKNAGFLTILQAPKALKQSMDVWGYSGNALGVMTDIKAKFDPQRLLSPGRFVGGL